MTRLMRIIAGVMLAMFLAACGGGGGSAGGTGDGDGGTGNDPPTAASFIYTLSKNDLENTGQDSVELMVTALDANNNPVLGVPVTVSVNNSAVYTPASTVTDASGKVSGAVTIGGSKANRIIDVTIVVSGQTVTLAIPVTGTTIALTTVPAVPAPGEAVQVNIKVFDFSKVNGISGATVTLSGTLGLTGTVTTDANGSASAQLASAPAAGGTIVASALGVQETLQVTVSGSGGSVIDPAEGPISSASIAIVPNQISPNQAGSETNRAAIKANFLNASNQAIENVRVRFEIVPPGLGSGEKISSGAAAVYSDASGNAIADYIAGTRSSPTDGVVIRACYGLTDESIAGTLCPEFVTGTLTVASQPLSITLGDNNLLEKGNNELTYIKKFDVAVNDSAGNAVADATVSASVDITHYGKGSYEGVAYPTGWNPPSASTPIDNTLDPGAGRVWCLNEDESRNGALDTDEDVNGNGTVEPRKADIVLSFIGSNKTNSSGRMTIQVEYPQNVATWLAYTVRVTTNVAGSEGTYAKSYITWAAKEDAENGSFWTPPYGAHACSAPD